jgi:hypothetical protein
MTPDTERGQAIGKLAVLIRQTRIAMLTILTGGGRVSESAHYDS